MMVNVDFENLSSLASELPVGNKTTLNFLGFEYSGDLTIEVSLSGHALKIKCANSVLVFRIPAHLREYGKLEK